MKNKTLNYGAVLVLMLVAPIVNAEDYPAASFQPKVVFRNEAAELAASTASTANSPCDSKISSSVKVEQTEFDAKYPAASFQPKVIYSNDNAKGS